MYDFNKIVELEIDLNLELSDKFKSIFKNAINTNTEILEHYCDFNKYEPMNIIEFLINLIFAPDNKKRKNINIEFYFELFVIIYQDKYEYFVPEHYINIIAFSLSSKINCCTLKMLKLLFDKKMYKYINLSNDEQEKLLCAYQINKNREYILCDFGKRIEKLILNCNHTNIKIIFFLLSNDTIFNKFYDSVKKSIIKINDIKQIKILWKINNVKSILLKNDYFFPQIKKRNYKIIKFLWSENKKKLVKLSYKNTNILDYACNNNGLVHNIVLLFLSSNHFSSMTKIKNKKSRDVVNAFIKNKDKIKIK